VEAAVVGSTLEVAVGSNPLVAAYADQPVDDDMGVRNLRRHNLGVVAAKGNPR